MHAELWLADIAAAEDRRWLALWLRRISPDEQVRLGRFSRPARRTQLIAGHALLRRAVAARSDCSVDDVRVAHDADGAPRIDRPEGLRVSLAHTGRWAAALLDRKDGEDAGARIGVDIELQREDRDIEAIVAMLGARPVSRADAYAHWVLHEAIYKAKRHAAAGWVGAWRELALAVAGIACPPLVRIADLARASEPVEIAVPWRARSIDGAAA
jgi:4'-phosphopantetheinyl transferase EntD